ncbi:protein CFAP20DC [Discoglossus pictus]
MFKNEYQGGAFVEIFSAQGKDPVAKWKLSGSQSAISKDFDKEVKSFVFVLEGSSQTNKMQLPKENKQMLGLIQRFLILQLYIPSGQDFSAELLITDLANIKRRLYLSTVHKELSATPLHAKIPLSIIKRKIWCNLCIDLTTFTSGIFKGAVFQSLDGIIISANCKLRKIFTMKLKPQDSVEEADIYGSSLSSAEPTDEIPRVCQISTDVHQVTQVLDMGKLQQNETKYEGRPLASADAADQLTNRGQGSSRSSRGHDRSHIAFGSKVQGPPPATVRKMSSRSSAETTKSTGGTDRSLNQLSHDEGGRSVQRTERRESRPTTTHSLDQRNKENIHQLRKKETQYQDYQSHLPQEPQSSDTSRRIKGEQNDDKEKMETDADSSSLGHCKTEDKLSVQIRVPSCERPNSAETLNNSRVLQQSANLTDDWIFPDSFQQDASKLSATQHQVDINNVSEELADNTKNDSTNQSETLLRDGDDIFTYCSVPRSAPHGMFQSFTLDHHKVSLDSKTLDSRGAPMDDDFYGSDSNIEETEIENFQWTSSPKSGHNGTNLSELSEFSQSNVASLDNSYRRPECVSSKDSVNTAHKEIISSNSHVYDIKITDFESIQKNLMPTRSLSPNGTRSEISRENSDTAKTQVISFNNVKSSLSKKSLKEISKEDLRLTADTSDYDWRNYQPNRLSVSEMQMLASLKRQHNEELEDDGTSHGLSQSQIEHCNVSISTSSDDTTTWTSCLPPPVNQGCHYQKEMNPLTHSNPRDWLNAFSPPIVPTSQNEGNMDPLTKLKKSSMSTCNDGDDGFGAEEDEVLTLLYDPCLNCYFDPETGKYYELA